MSFTGKVLSNVDNPSLGNVLKHEYAAEQRYCRDVLTIANTTGMVVGTVLIDGAIATAALAAAFNPATQSIVIVADETMYDDRANGVTAGDYAVLARGAAVVRQGGLVTADINTEAEFADLESALLTAGIKVAKSFGSDELKS